MVIFHQLWEVLQMLFLSEKKIISCPWLEKVTHVLKKITHYKIVSSLRNRQILFSHFVCEQDQQWKLLCYFHLIILFWKRTLEKQYCSLSDIFRSFAIFIRQPILFWSHPAAYDSRTYLLAGKKVVVVFAVISSSNSSLAKAFNQPLRQFWGQTTTSIVDCRNN